MSDVAIVTTDLFGKASLRRFKTIGPLPVRGVHVRIQSLTEREKSNWESETIAKKGDGLRVDKLRDANRRLLQLCLVDEDGNRFVTDAMRTEMGEWDSADTAFLYDECSRHCGINKADLEGLVKNSEGTTVVG